MPSQSNLSGTTLGQPELPCFPLDPLSVYKLIDGEIHDTQTEASGEIPSERV